MRPMLLTWPAPTRMACHPPSQNITRMTLVVTAGVLVAREVSGNIPGTPRLILKKVKISLQNHSQKWDFGYCAVGATFWTATNEEERSMAKKEFRRGSIRRVLSRIRGSDQGPPFELFRDYTDVFETSKWVRATSRSTSNLFVWCLMKPFQDFWGR